MQVAHSGAAGWAGRIAIAVAMACAMIPAVAVAADSHSRSAVVETDRGLIRGTQTTTTRQFLGVPYAATPVGDLRWRPPQPHTRWTGVRDATRFAAHCPQGATPFGQASTSEDCLFLNVFAPARTRDELAHRAP